MPSTMHRSRSLALAAAAVLLTLPVPTLAADEGDWGFRQSFRSYVYAGNGAPPIAAVIGATCDANPDAARGGCDPKLAATTDVFGWTATDSNYTLPDGAATIDLQGQVTFIRPDHFFTMAVIDPIVTIDANGDAIVNVHIDLDSDFPSVPDHDGRLNFGAFELTSLTETATTVTWELGNGAVTTEAATALGNFLTAGAALDPIRIVLPLNEQPAPTITPTAVRTPGPTATPSPGRVCGDADGNGQVSVTDGVNVLRTAAGLSGACSDPAPCDVDGNGAVSVTDGVNVLRAAAGLTVDFQCFDLE